MYSLDALEKVFMASAKPYWILYKGVSKNTGMTCANHLVQGEDDLETCWGKLEAMLEVLEDGVYCIELRNHSNTARGNPVYQFYKGAEPPKQPERGAQMGAILSQPPANSIPLEVYLGKVEEINGLKLEIAELKHQLAKEKETVEALNGAPDEAPVHPFFSLVKDNFPHFADLLKTYLPPKAAQQTISEMGAALGRVESTKGAEIPSQKQEHTMSQETPSQVQQDNEPIQPPTNLSADWVIHASQRIQAVLPDININQMLMNLAEFVEKNPAMARQMLTQI